MDRDLRRRLAAGVGVGALLLFVGYVLLSFVAVAVFAVFLYYAVRPIFRFLARLGLGRRVRAVLAIVLFGIPFLVLIAYAVAIVAIEIRDFLDAESADRVAAELNIGELNLEQLETVAAGEQTDGSLDVVVDSLLNAASVVGSVLVQLLLVVIITYYMLVDGPRLVDFFLDRYDESGITRRYVDAVDGELGIALFGNIVNVFVTAIITIAIFFTYNGFVPSTVAVPYPALLGALAGIGSLIPVVGIKLVYVPLTVGLGANAWLAGEPELLGPVAVLFVVSAVVVDFIPDFVIRALVSSDDTHTGMLLIAYILGPAVFGFYGLFLAPVVLVCTTNALTILLPYVVDGTRPDDPQRTLDSFADANPDQQPATGDDGRDD